MNPPASPSPGTGQAAKSEGARRGRPPELLGHAHGAVGERDGGLVSSLQGSVDGGLDQGPDELARRPEWLEEQQRLAGQRPCPWVAQARQWKNELIERAGFRGDVAHVSIQPDGCVERIDGITVPTGLARRHPKSRECGRASRVPNRDQRQGPLEERHGCASVEVQRPVAGKSQEPACGWPQVRSLLSLARRLRELQRRRVVVGEHVRDVLGATCREGLDPPRRGDVT